MKPIKKILVEIDLTNLDENIYYRKNIKRLNLTYYNVGEDIDWNESPPFKIIKIKK